MSSFRAYIRVSSSRQAREGLSLDEQEERLRAAAPDQDEVVLYREAGVSGRKASRPELDRLMADVQADDIVAVVALDRFGRSATNVALNVREIGERGAQFVSLREQVDTSTASGRFFFMVMAALGEMESELIGERVKATRPAALRRRGRYFGGIRGYGRERDGSVRASEAKVIRETIVPRFLEGLALRQLARELEDAGIPTVRGATWRATGISKLLKRPDLANLVLVEGALIEGSLEPIISRETWDRVQDLFAARQTGEARGRPAIAGYVLDKPLDIRCGCCGSRMRPRTIRRNGRQSRELLRYVCIRRETYGTCACAMPRVAKEDVDPILIALFRRSWIDEAATLAAIEKAANSAKGDVESALRQAEREAARADERLARVRRDYADGGLTLDEWRGFRDEIEDERKGGLAEVERLRLRLAELEDEGPLRDAERAMHRLLEHMRLLAERYEDVPEDGALVQAIRAALYQMVERIVVHPLVGESDPERIDNPRSTFLVTDTLIIEIVARETAPAPVQMLDGSRIYADSPHFERTALPVADITQIGSMIWSDPSAFVE